MCVGDQIRGSGNSLGKAGCYVTWTRVATGKMERTGKILHSRGEISGIRSEGEGGSGVISRLLACPDGS